MVGWPNLINYLGQLKQAGVTRHIYTAVQRLVCVLVKLTQTDQLYRFLVER